MRLFLATAMVAATFAFIVLLLSRLFPDGSGWTGVCFAITCLYASTFAAWVLIGKQTKQGAPVMQDEIARGRVIRDNLLYFAVAIAVVAIVIAVVIHDTERGIHRHFKNDWFVGLGSAGVALGYAAKVFWISRQNWRFWAVIAALLGLFTATTIPPLSQMDKVPLLLMGPLANIELLIAFVVLDRLIGTQPGRRETP